VNSWPGDGVLKGDGRAGIRNEKEKEKEKETETEPSVVVCVR
jgi:hypothetical protein